jgi:hypothetical protein
LTRFTLFDRRSESASAWLRESEKISSVYDIYNQYDVISASNRFELESIVGIDFAPACVLLQTRNKAECIERGRVSQQNAASCFGRLLSELTPSPRYVSPADSFILSKMNEMKLARNGGIASSQFLMLFAYERSEAKHPLG